jgi:hypothetical protein
MTLDPSQSGVLSRYQTYLLPVYADICGDVDSYFSVGPQFEQFLSQHSRYESVSAQTADPEDAAAALRGFLQGGRNCHETSFVTRMENETRSLAQALAEETRGSADDHQFHEQWRMFRNSYLDRLNHIAGLANRGFFQQAAGRDDRWKLNTALLQRVARTSAVTDAFADEVLTEVMAKIGDRAPSSPELALVRAQLSQVRTLRKLAAALRYSASSLDAPETGALMKDAAKFNETLTVMTHPILWAYFVFTEAGRYDGALNPKFKIEVKVPPQLMSVSGTDSALLMDLMDLVFIFTAKGGMPLQISLSGSQDALVIASAGSLKNARRDKAIADLTERLKGKWRTPGWLGSIVTRDGAHSITIPLEGSGTSGGSGTRAGGVPAGRIVSFSPSPEIGRASRSPTEINQRSQLAAPQWSVRGSSFSTNAYLGILFSPGVGIFSPLLRAPAYAK